MSPEVWKQIEELYLAARDASTEQRAALLGQAGPEVRDRVSAMLSQDRSLLDHPAWHGREWLLGETAASPAMQLGPYRIEHLIGEGGMGRVYRAIDTRLGRTVALKLLAPELAAEREFRRRFLHEARAASALNHPNIVVLHDIASQDGVDFLVMEYVAGRTLKEIIPPGGLPFNQLAALGSQIALALGAAHAAGIVHRDIKPSNILVTPREEVKVVDFGVAKVPLDDTETKVTRHGAIVGTAAYMSPEQTRGEEVDAPSDIFSFGSVLYEAATGRQPFHGASTLEVLHQIATADPDPPDILRPDLPREFAVLVMRCLEKSPRARPDSAVELATQLKALSLPAKPQAILRAGQPALAVIPLQLRGPAAEQYLSTSLADALIYRLSSSGKLVVRPIASVMRYAGKEIPWAQAARELNVDILVEGVIQILGTKIRLLVQAHRTSDSHTLASIKLDGDSGDLFALQDRLADAVNDVFLPRQKQTDRLAPPTKHAGAYELYLRAVDRQVHLNKFDLGSAIEMLNRATELDPTFADAWGLLAQACVQMGAYLDPDPKWFELGERAIVRALELDPVQCESLCARGVILFSHSRGFQGRAALRAHNAALKIDPQRVTARNMRCGLLWHLGFMDAASEDAEELQNPALAASHKAHISLFRGDFDASAHFFQTAQGLEPVSLLHHVDAPLAPLWAGRMDDARKALDKAAQMTPGEPFTLALEALFAALGGDFTRAEGLAEEAAHGRSVTHSHHTRHYCAGAWALCGKPEKAMAELQHCASLGLPNHLIFEMDPHLRSLHDHSDFRKLMQSLRREHQSIKDEFGLETSSRLAGHQSAQSRRAGS